MEPDDLPGTNPNTLPYFITEAQTGRVVPVRFEQINAADQTELRNEDWQQAVFRDVWPELVRDDHTLKLVCDGGEDARIQGMVRFGNLTRRSKLLKTNLLEAAPFNRHGRQLQAYRGVGRVLVARLVVESVLQGGHGRVAVLARTGTEPFYRALGFVNPPPMSLDVQEKIKQLLQTALASTPQAEGET